MWSRPGVMRLTGKCQGWRGRDRGVRGKGGSWSSIEVKGERERLPSVREGTRGKTGFEGRCLDLCQSPLKTSRSQGRSLRSGALRLNGDQETWPMLGAAASSSVARILGSALGRMFRIRKLKQSVKCNI